MGLNLVSDSLHLINRNCVDVPIFFTYEFNGNFFMYKCPFIYSAKQIFVRIVVHSNVLEKEMAYLNYSIITNYF